LEKVAWKTPNHRHSYKLLKQFITSLWSLHVLLVLSVDSRAHLSLNQQMIITTW